MTKVIGMIRDDLGTKRFISIWVVVLDDELMSIKSLGNIFSLLRAV